MIIVFFKQAECQNRFSHLVEIEDKAESDRLASTFLNPGNGIVLHFYIYIYIYKKQFQNKLSLPLGVLVLSPF